MAFNFNADDIFEIAEQIEKNGVQFYNSAAKNIGNQAQKKLLLDLAGMEQEHERIFTAMRADLKKTERQETAFDPEGESMHYLKALAQTRVFFEKKIDITSIEEILKAAIMAEKDSLAFYIGMKDFVPESLGKSRLDTIISEEKKHLQLLSNELIALKK